MKKGDLLLISIILTLCLISLFLMKNSDLSSKNKYISIQVDKEIVKKIAINNKTNKIYQFYFKDQIGYIQVKNNKVRILEMEREICPKKICSEIGWISKKYETIVCLPNKISINIMEDNKIGNEPIDDIAF